MSQFHFALKAMTKIIFIKQGKNHHMAVAVLKIKRSFFAGSYAEVVYHCSRNLRGNPEEGENVGTEDHDALEDKIKDAVVCAIFESLDLLHETKGSLKNFEELLTMARHMYCKRAGLGEDDKTVKKKWPSDWTAARQMLIAEGYEDAK